MLPAGLSAKQVLARQKEFGFNEIVDEKSKYLVLKLIWHQLNNLLIYILFISAIITYLLDHAVDTYVILAVIFFNTLIGFIQEYRASKAISALKSLVVAKAKVYRDGQLTEISSRELVPGDVVLVEEGDRIPADGQLLEAKSLRVVESSLTGEAFPVDKNTTLSSEQIAMADRQDRVWMSTFVASGMGKFMVTATASQTAIGQIAKNLKEIKREKTHFEIKTNLLAKQMSIVAVLGTIATFLVGFFVRDYSFVEIFTFSVASLVSSVPEGLPAVIMIILASGASRMARKKAIVRSLPSMETLSVVDVIATDKTGTLTQNTMTVKEVFYQGRRVEVSGDGWSPIGKFYLGQKELNLDEESDLQAINLAAGLCSRARLLKHELPGKTDYEISGDPTEGALLVLAHKANLQVDLEKIEILDELPFDQSKKFKAVLVKIGKQNKIFVSGAAESIVALSNLNKLEAEKILTEVQKSSAQARRVIALASLEMSTKTTELNSGDIKNLNFLGFVGMIDPPREGVAEAVLKAKRAGIRVIMKTGDHRETALAIAKQVKIVGLEETQVLTGVELEALSDLEFEQAIEKVSVFARLTPDMKLRILQTMQKKGHVVAMTGDGVNDVLALKKANIGIAMGKIGTDAARESSDIVLADDNFSSLIDAVEEGRIIFTNTRQASAFLLTTNFTEDLIILLAVFFAFPLPILASQILWLNLVTDGLTDMALAAEPGHGDVLLQKPKRKGEGILTKRMLAFILPIIVTMTFVSLFIFLEILPQSLEKARTAVFCAMCFTQLINIFNMRSLDLSIFKIGWLSNKYVVATVFFSLFLQYLAMTQESFMSIFKFTALSLSEVLIIFALSLLVLVVGEGLKFARHFQSAKN